MIIDIYTDWWCIKNPWWKWSFAFFIKENNGFWFWTSEETTNNLMELYWIKSAIDYVIYNNSDISDMELNIYSDSKYALWVIWWTMKAKVHRSLISTIQRSTHGFKSVTLNYVKWHSWNEYNEFCDSVCSILLEWWNPESYISSFIS